MIPILAAMRVYVIITGDDSEQQPLDLDHHDDYADSNAKTPRIHL